MQRSLKATVLGVTLAVCLAVVVAEEVRRDTDPESGLARWSLHSGSISSVQLIQRLPDQTHAFFLGRGLTTETVNALAGSCVFQAIIRNAAESDGPMIT